MSPTAQAIEPVSPTMLTLVAAVPVVHVTLVPLFVTLFLPEHVSSQANVQPPLKHVVVVSAVVNLRPVCVCVWGRGEERTLWAASNVSLC